MKQFVFKIFIISFMISIIFEINVHANIIQASQAYFPVKDYQTKTIVDGQPILYDFVIQNKGEAPLNISEVETGWGCTAVSYPKLIPAGGKGVISIKVDTSNFGGRNVKKTVDVFTDDPKNPEIKLTIGGYVEKFVIIEPKKINLKGKIGEEIEQRVKISTLEKYPFNITKIVFKG